MKKSTTGFRQCTYKKWQIKERCYSLVVCVWYIRVPHEGSNPKPLHFPSRCSTTEPCRTGLLSLSLIIWIACMSNLFTFDDSNFSDLSTALLLLVSVIERLVLSHGQRLNKSNSQWVKLIIFSLLVTRREDLKPL